MTTWSGLRLALPVAGALCAIGLFVFSQALCKGERCQFIGGDQPDAVQRVEQLRGDFNKGQTALLQAIERLQRQRSVQLPGPLAPLQDPAGTAANATGKGPVLDSVSASAAENKAESQYWDQRQEKLANIRWEFIGYTPQWPCLWGEESTGRGPGDGHGNKWTCGARLIQSPCVVYSFGSNGNLMFESGIFDLGLACEIHIYDPTVAESPRAKEIGAKYHSVGLGGKDGFQGRFPVKTLKTLMNENGHTHIDILKVDIEDAEHQALPQVALDGWPSVGQFLIEVHLRGKYGDDHLERLFEVVEQANLRLFHQEVNWRYGAWCCVEYAFIHKNWRPEIKNYDMKKAASYKQILRKNSWRKPI